MQKWDGGKNDGTERNFSADLVNRFENSGLTLAYFTFFKKKLLQYIMVKVAVPSRKRDVKQFTKHSYTFEKMQFKRIHETYIIIPSRKLTEHD